MFSGLPPAIILTMESSPTRRGFALATTLLFVSLLVLMVGALFLAVRNKLFLSRTYNDQTAALYLAELAVHDARTELEADPSWTAGFTDKSFPGVRGTYSVTFNTSGAPFSPLESVNNADGAQEETYHGPGTLRGGHCLIVATARVGRASRTLEALVEVSGGLPPLDVPLLNDGKIVLRGEAVIEGVRSLYDRTPVPAGIHSNLVNGDPANVDLTTATNTSNITGMISSSGSNGAAVQLGAYGATHSGGSAANAAQKSYPDVDIVSRVSGKTGAPTPTFAATGTTTLSADISHEYYYFGPVNLNGDLKLENVNLYVDGPLTVNGALEGQGSIYVTGKSSFLGTTSVSAALPDKIALFSHGSVEIRGFDGTAFLNAIGSADPNFQVRLDNYRFHMGQFLTKIADPNQTWGQDSELDEHREAIARGKYSTPMAYGNNSNLARDLSYLLSQQPPSSAQQPLVEKFDNITNLFSGINDSSEDAIETLDRAEGGQLANYSIDVLLDLEVRSQAPAMEGLVGSINFDRPGEAFFQGLVYTHGYFHASEEVTIIGAVAALTSTTGPPVPTETVGTDTLNPGDVYLLDGSRLLFVEDFFNPPVIHPGPGGEGSALVLWMGR